MTHISGAVLEPEFEQPDYTVPENGGPVEVCVVQNQELERDVVISLQTSDGSAMGTCVYTYNASTITQYRD